MVQVFRLEKKINKGGMSVYNTSIIQTSTNICAVFWKCSCREVTFTLFSSMGYIIYAYIYIIEHRNNVCYISLV